MKQDRPPTIIGLIAICAAVYLFQISLGDGLTDHTLIPVEQTHALSDLTSGEGQVGTFRTFAKLLTAVFLHASEEHIIYNMAFLWAFGVLCAKSLGQWSALVLFLGGGVIGNIVQCWLNPQSPVPVLGASGGVMAFEGVYLGLALRWRLPDPDVWPLAYPIPQARMAAFGVVGFGIDWYRLMNHDAGNVAFGAHIGGFVFGFLLAWLITYRYPTSDCYIKGGRKK